MVGLVDQQKDDNSRLSVRLTGTEKQRDDALEALVLQQEIAEELERERKRNKRELAALQQTNTAMVRQRDEARRVVLHLRSLIGGQSHHMEHLVRSLTTPDDMMNEIADGFEVDDDDDFESNGKCSLLRLREHFLTFLKVASVPPVEITPSVCRLPALRMLQTAN